MELVSSESVFNEAKSALEGKDADGNAHPIDLDKSEKLLNELLNNNVGHPVVLYVLASLHLTRANYGLAIQLFTQITQAEPTFGEAWNNLAMAFRGINDWDKAVLCATKASKYIDHADVPTNVSGLHLNRGKPEIALEWAEKALAKAPDHVKAQWHKAMALLEMGRWDDAWEIHESRLTGGADRSIAERNYHGPDDMTPWWDGKAEGTVVIHGEQGMGDEIMFASCIPDAIATGATFILEPSPRLDGLFRRTFPTTFVHGTDDVDGRGWKLERAKPDFKIAMGSLPRLFRRNQSDCPGTPYLVPDPARRAWWGDKLKVCGNRPRIGLAWQGGVQQTRGEARSVHPSLVGPLFAAFDCTWVSLQYDQTAKACVDQVRGQGIDLYHWPKAVEAIDPETGKLSDLDELAALISQLDLVITVPQTAYHFAGALGVPCWVLVQTEPDWRLGVTGDTNAWYNSVSLIRQETKGDWTGPINEVAKRLGPWLAERDRKTA